MSAATVPTTQVHGCVAPFPLFLITIITTAIIIITITNDYSHVHVRYIMPIIKIFLVMIITRNAYAHQ